MVRIHGLGSKVGVLGSIGLIPLTPRGIFPRNRAPICVPENMSRAMTPELLDYPLVFRRSDSGLILLSCMLIWCYRYALYWLTCTV